MHIHNRMHTRNGDENFACYNYEPPGGDQLGCKHSQEQPAVNGTGMDGDEDGDVLPQYMREYDVKAVADILGAVETSFKTIRANQEAQEPLSQCGYLPFTNYDEWELAEWLIRNVNQQGMDKFLRLPVIRLRFSYDMINTYILADERLHRTEL
jgi:hypothetical protein